MLEEQILNTIKEHKMLSPGDLVVVGLSGGADSLTLVNVLDALKQELQISLHIAHLNHALRGSCADQDENFVVNFARSRNIPVVVERQDVKAFAEQNKYGIEEAARMLRYNFFENLASRLGASKIAVGHTADDNIETFLMHLMRGSGAKGMMGIPPKRGKIIRPLIDTWRDEIEKYCASKKLIPRVDYTNYETRYLRNRIRLKLIPQLKIFNPKIKESLVQSIGLLTSDYIFLNQRTQELLAEIILEEKKNYLCLSAEKLKNQDPALQGHILRAAIERVKGDLTGIAFVHIKDILGLLTETEKKEINLPAGIFALIDRGKLVVSQGKTRQKQVMPFEYCLKVPGAIKIKELGLEIEAEWEARQVKSVKSEDPYTVVLDGWRIGDELVIRNRREGDSFRPLGIWGTKKLQDFFVDEKIPQDQRDAIPLVLSKNEIIWVVGLRINDQYKITLQSSRFIRLTSRKI